jgi:hypothetical protein
MQLVGYAGAGKIEKVRFAQDDGFVCGLACSWLDMREHERSKKSQSLRMTACLRACMQLVGYAGARKIEKVTVAQDDDFVWGQLVGYARSDDDFVGV